MLGREHKTMRISVTEGQRNHKTKQNKIGDAGDGILKRYRKTHNLGPDWLLMEMAEQISKAEILVICVVVL